MFIDASGHDQNCAYAADPRNKCNCTPADVRVMSADHASAPPFAGVTADQIEQQAPAIGRIDQWGRAMTVQQQILHCRERGIERAANDVFGAGNWNRAEMTARDVGQKSAPGVSEIWSFKGVEFLRYGLDFKTREHDGNTVTMVSQSFKTIGGAEK